MISEDYRAHRVRFKQACPSHDPEKTVIGCRGCGNQVQAYLWDVVTDDTNDPVTLTEEADAKNVMARTSPTLAHWGARLGGV